MTITSDDVRTKFPAFEDEIVYADESIDMAIQMAVMELGDDPNYWCGVDKYSSMLLYLAAHHLTIWTRQASGDSSAIRNISSKSVGSVSVSYSADGTQGQSASFYSTTSYGQFFNMLKKKCKPFAGLSVATV